MRPARARRISAVAARRLAARHLVKQLLSGRVRDGAKARWTAFGVRRADVWLVYKRAPDLALRSAEVIAVCKLTGRILYDGPANDEG